MGVYKGALPAVTTTPKVNKEAVRLLAIQIGVRPAARKLGLNEDTVCSWAKRDNWFVVPANPQTLQAPQAPSPGDVMLNTLAEHERKTKLGLASYASTQAQHLAKNGKLTDSGHFKNVAGGASIVHRWDAKSENTQNVVVNVALLGVQPHEVSATVLDVDPEGQGSGE